MTTASVRGITVGYDQIGDGNDALLFVHGHPFNRSMWKGQLGAASSVGWRVVAPDLRGYGESTVVPGITTLDVFADDLAALLDQLAIERVVIVGLSMGGQIAMEFARLHPRRLRGLVLAATFPEAETEDGKRRRAEMGERLLREGMNGYADEVLPKMLAPRSIEARPADAGHVLEMMRTTNPAGAAAAVRGRGERPSYEPTLASVTVPTLIVVGSEDAFTTRHQAETMRDLVSGSELVWLDGVGHMPNIESPEAFNAALIKFLARV